MTDSKRLTWIDWAKFLLIWMMVWGHAGLSGVGHQFVYAFHMPAFFIISGYLYKPHNWKRTLISFGVPVIFFSLFYLIYEVSRMYLKGEPYECFELINKIAPPMFERNYGDNITLFTGLWFIEALFFIRLLLGDIKKLTFIRNKYKIIGLLLFLYCSFEPLFIKYIHPIDDLYIYKVLPCFPFMMFGIYLKEEKKEWLNLKNWQLAILLVIYVSMTLLNSDVDIFSEHFGINYSYTFVNAIIASILFFNILSRFKCSKIAETFSVGTLLILGMHSMIIQTYNMLVNHMGFPSSSFLSSLLVMIICYPLIRLAIRYAPLLLGKYHKK